MSSQTLPARVYSNYRATLRSRPRNVHSRAAERKQYAREVTSIRFNLPISEVKSIVREFDIANGITHEHPEPYMKELAVAKRFTAAQAAYDANPTPCKCGNTELVRVRPHPIAFAERSEWVVLLSCFECYVNKKHGK